MRIRLPLVAAALLVLAPLSFAEPVAKGMWDGCKEGSWVQMKMSTKMVIPGVEIPDQVSESRQTLVKVTDEAWTVKSETKVGDAWENATEFSYPRVAPKAPVDTKEMPKPEDLGTEKVSVEGKDYACKKSKITLGGITTITWIHADEGMLKSESTGDASSSLVVIALAKKVKIGDKEVVCREMKMTSKAAGSETTTTHLSSNAVPGLMVRMETTMESPTKMTSVTEATAFEIK